MLYFKRFGIPLLFLICTTAAAQNDLDVIKNKWLEYSDASNSLYRHLVRQAFSFLDDRENKMSKLQTLADWQQRQEYIRKTLLDIVGPFPEKTPLNAKIVRVIDKGSFRVEHIIFESQPGFFVTSSMYIPKGIKQNRKAPAIIYCSGHSEDGYRNAIYQHVILNLVNKGFVVYAFDPVGQGERLEYYDSGKKTSFIGGPTKEHSYPGAQAFLTGSSQARYMIWDGIRSVDYLVSRKEVDPARIGITGRSGGGTQSSFIAAMDERIYAAAPENYLTNYRRLLQTIGPQDAEQNMFNIIAKGLDHPDYLIVRAPKPAMMITTSGDMFSIQGATETEKEVKRIYKAYGLEGNFYRVEDDAGHTSTLKNREAMYAFFQKHLNNPGNPQDEEIPLLSNEELMVTDSGQVSVSLAGETVFSLTRKMAEKLNDNLILLRKDPDKFIPGAVISAKLLSGYVEPSLSDEPVFTGRIVKEKYAVEKYFLKGEGDYVIPYLLFKPVNAGNKFMIYLDPAGKSADAGVGGEIEKFVLQGITVLSPDLIGTGETGPGELRGDAYIGNVSHNLWYASMIIGRSITGVRSGDVVKLVRLIGNKNTGIIGFAKGEMVPVMLHAAAFCCNIKNVILIGSYSSYTSIALTRLYKPDFVMSAVPGALEKYDLPDLAVSIAPRKLIILNPVDAEGKTTDSAIINKDMDVVKAGYRNKSAEGNLIILTEYNLKDQFDNFVEMILSAE